jgi:hypothetical protein
MLKPLPPCYLFTQADRYQRVCDKVTRNGGWQVYTVLPCDLPVRRSPFYRFTFGSCRPIYRHIRIRLAATSTEEPALLSRTGLSVRSRKVTEVGGQRHISHAVTTIFSTAFDPSCFCARCASWLLGNAIVGAAEPPTELAVDILHHHRIRVDVGLVVRVEVSGRELVQHGWALRDDSG